MQKISIYGGKYEVTSDGQVISAYTGKPLKPFINKLGYAQVGLVGSKSKRNCYRVHRLVALAFLTEVPGCNEVNHIDGNKLNNDISNLEWSNRQHNTQHAYDNGLIKSLGRRRKPFTLDRLSPPKRMIIDRLLQCDYKDNLSKLAHEIDLLDNHIYMHINRLIEDGLVERVNKKHYRVVKSLKS